MRTEFLSYFDQLMRLDPQGDNGILYTAEYSTLAKADDQITQRQVRALLQAVNPTDSKTIWSRDNHFGYIALSKRFGFNFHEKLYLSNIKYLIQPNDVIFWLWASEGLIGLLATPFLFISSLAMIFTVLITSYKTIDGVKVLATDGQKLTRLTINSFNLPITKNICNYIVNKKYGGWQIFYSTYFKNPEHPINVLIKEQNI